MSVAYQTLVRVLREALGFVIFENEQGDFAISDYVPDSRAFMQFITAIEEDIGEELSDDFLDYEILSSAKGFAEKLDSFIIFQQHKNPNMQKI